MILRALSCDFGSIISGCHTKVIPGGCSRGRIDFVHMSCSAVL